MWASDRWRYTNLNELYSVEKNKEKLVLTLEYGMRIMWGVWEPAKGNITSLIILLKANMYSVQLRYVGKKAKIPVKVLHNDIVLWEKYVSSDESDLSSVVEDIEMKLKQIKEIEGKKSDNSNSVSEDIKMKLEQIKEIEDIKTKKIKEEEDMRIVNLKRHSGPQKSLYSVKKNKEKLVLTLEYGIPPGLSKIDCLIKILNLNMYSVQLKYMGDKILSPVRVLYKDTVLWEKLITRENVNFKSIAEGIVRKVRIKNFKKVEE